MSLPPKGGHWLVVRGGALGDFVLTLPVLRAIRQRADRVTLVAAPRYAALVPELYDHLIDGQGTDALWLHGAGRPPHPYDAAVVVTPGVAEHLGKQGVPHIRQIAAHPPEATHMGTHLWSAVADWAGAQWPRHTLQPTPASRPQFEAVLAGRRPIVLAPDTAGEGKRWPHMEALAHRLIAGGASVVWVPGRDRPTPAPCPIPELRLDLDGIVALANTCAVWVGNDTGTTHLASAAGARTWVFFGATDPGTWAPPRSTIFAFNAPIEEMAQRLLSHTSAAD